MKQKCKTTFVDRVNFAMAPFYEPMVQLFIEFKGSVDKEILSKALRLTLDAEPVLGCRFVPRFFTPFWQRLSDDELDSTPLLQTEISAENFMAEYVDPLKGPQVAAALINGNKLHIKINHMVVDAAATKAYGYLLAKTYRELLHNPDFKPEANLGSRSMKQVFKSFGYFSRLKILRRFVRDIILLSRPNGCLSYPSGSKAIGKPVFCFKRFSKDRVQALAGYGAKTGATLNDMIVTAQIRAVAKQLDWNGEKSLRYVGTVDLRRYLPSKRPEALGNFSSHYFLNLGKDTDETFDQTLAKVKAGIDFQKKDFIGLGKMLGEYLSYIGYPFPVMVKMMRFVYGSQMKKGNSPISLTNLGAIDPAVLDFGEAKTTRAEMIPPVSMPPVMFTGLSGFAGTLTLSIGFYESAMPKDKIEELFDRIEKELPV